MARASLAAGLLVALLVAAGCASPAAAPIVPDPRPETENLDRAVAAALARTAGVRAQAGPCRVILAREFQREGRWTWTVALKPLRLLDTTTGPVAAGGEIYVNVDLADGSTTLGLGE